MEYFLKLVAYFKIHGVHESCWALSDFYGVFQYCPDRYLYAQIPFFLHITGTSPVMLTTQKKR